MAAYGTDQELMQRLLTVESRKKSQLTTLATPIAGFLVMILYLIIGAGLFRVYQHIPGSRSRPKADDIYSQFASFQMPAILRGLVLTAVVMASIDSPLGSLTTSFVNDIYRPLLRPDQLDTHYMKVSRIMVVIFGVILAVLAFSFSFLKDFCGGRLKSAGSHTDRFSAFFSSASSPSVTPTRPILFP